MGTKFISIISGKGGTGKSLFTAVLGNCLSKERCKVLLVDMDIHVRGLTILLSKYIGVEEGVSVTDCLVMGADHKKFAIYRFQECEIMPAVLDIAQPLNREIRDDAVDDFLENLYVYARKEYDIVLLDCRSGLDDSLVRIAKKSDFIISVSEDDDVCLQSNSNLVNYMRYTEGINNIYTVINKGRRVQKREDIDRKINDIFDFNCLGVIPFDETIMENYGKDRFWLTVYDTLYFYGVVKFWDAFRKKASIIYGISEDKYSFRVKRSTTMNMSFVFRLYGLVALISGIILPLIFSLGGIYTNGIDIMTRILSIIGLLMLAFSSRKFRRFLLGKDDDPKSKI